MKEVLIGTFILVALLLLSAILFVGIVWTHRPDMSLPDVVRECIREIREKNAGG